MTISINEINVRNLGPIRTFSQSLGKINLIYGHNERGKTMLVEFLIRSLFKDTKAWPLRKIMGEGSVTVSGLEEAPIQIKPGSAKKLEDYWERGDAEIPQDISKLLVVRAAEVELTNKEACGIDKHILQEYLSGKGVIDSIQGKVAGVLKKASFENGLIIGGIESGIKKNLSVLDGKLERFTEMVERYHTHFSQGRLHELQKNERVMTAKFDALEAAKRHAAYVCHKEIEKINEQLSQYPEETLDAIQEAITKLTTKKQDAEQAEDDLGKAKKTSKHYAWLEEAITLYEKRESLSLPKYHTIWLAAAGLCLAAFLILAFGFGFPIRDYGMIALLAGMVGGIGAYIYALLKLLKNKNTLEDIRDIQQSYQNKFGSSLRGLAELQAALKEMAEPYHSINTLKDRLDRLKVEIAEINTDIINNFISIARVKVPVADFECRYAEMKDKKKKLEIALGKANTQFAGLDIDPAEYVEDEAAETYNKVAFEDTRQVLETVREEISDEKIGLMQLKQELCGLTGKDIDEAWDVILDDLLTKQAGLIAARKQLKADIIAQILVNQSLDSYREKEDENIRAGLRSKALVGALKAVTGRYTHIELAGDALVVSDGFGEYSFSDLSTGTQEQIFLALRIAFAARVSKNDTLFFILDDAFQYSDWERRELLVDKMIDLAKHDWQVIYFSMDDHIRDLFVKKAGKVFKDEFRLITIEEN
jgi:predicted  nucleic acid-binding Zn-ribbon protein